MEEIKILWTGGWDSTFRMIELSRKNVVIQPIYVLDSERKSTDNELKAMDKIIQDLNKRDETKAKINAIKIIKKEDIPENKEITDAYKIINARTRLGSQHDWLARLAVEYKGIEIGTDAGTPDTSHIIQAINEFGKLVIEDGIGYMDKEKSSNEGRLVLGNFRYPIIEKTEKQMLNIIKEEKYEEIMKHIWFCHSPINGKPCGICHPCCVKIESGMEFLLPQEAIKRYRKSKKLEKIFGESMANRIILLCIRLKKKVDKVIKI